MPAAKITGINMQIVPVILSGGVGSRLWPLSREGFPKQFQPLASARSLIVETIERITDLPSVGAPLVVCNDEHRFMVAEQLRGAGIEGATIILEPAGRNTAPALALAAQQLVAVGDDVLMLVLPADHVIQDVTAFHAAVVEGAPHAEKGGLVTFGIEPTAAETGYGYIRKGEALGGNSYAIGEFVEKPDRDTAQRYLDSGDYAWNSGMFLLRASVVVDELQQHAPDILAACSAAMQDAANDLDFVRPATEAFLASPSDSIDYAVMEKTDRGVVVTLACGWSDVGAWSSLWDVGERDDDGNVAIGDVVSRDTRNSYLRSDHRLVATVGIDDVVVVETADAVLVAGRDQVQNVKQIVSALKAAGRGEADLHKQVFRPWGSYESLVSAERFQVKRIIVNPEQRLSLQMHHHRAEHWIVVKGTALVTCGEREFTLSEDESTYIPLGTRHRLSNPGVIPLEIIEVQSGSYLGEDDIVRFEDVYGRSDST